MRLLMPARNRLVLLCTLGVLLTLSVAGAAMAALVDLGAMNQRLAEVNRAQRFHQDADMMHDALRADVARAQQSGSGTGGIRPDVVRHETAQHAALYRDDVAAAAALGLPEPLRRALADLRPGQEAYIDSAERLVHAAVHGRGSPPGELAGFQRTFRDLVPLHADVTQRLASASERTEAAVQRSRASAGRVVGLASLGAIAGWLALVGWHHRSQRRLQRALVREEAQRSVADALARSLLPHRLPDVAGFGLAARSLPGRRGQRVGGDWYDVFHLPGGRVGLAVGDVIGHGLDAAAAMAQLRNALRVYALDEPSPADVLARVNRAAGLLEVVELATCLYAVLDPDELSLRWASAGHLAPLVTSESGPGRLVTADPGPPLGALDSPEFTDHDLRLTPGQALVLYTDGLVERRGECIDTGLDQLASVVATHADADHLCDRLMRAMDVESAQGDDVTLLVVRAADAADAAERVA